jgi:hypothetical protein
VKLRSFRTVAPRWARYDIWNVGIATLDRPLGDVRELMNIFGGPERPAPHPFGGPAPHPSDTPRPAPHSSGSGIQWLPPQPPLRFIADPFPYRDLHGREWLLVEDYGHHTRERGRISRIDPNDPSSALEPAIVRERHISYPFTFTDGSDVYCAPEMSREEGCVLYRLQEDGAWIPAHHILRGVPIVDPTFLRRDHRWWLFGTAPTPLHNRVLDAFYADALAGPWTPHGRNPIKDDPASARPAGRPFRIGNRWYRPAQDCRATYGGAVHVMEIEELTPTAFNESLALRLEPNPSWPYPDGLHHLVVDGARVYFDAKRTHVDPTLWARIRSR